MKCPLQVVSVIQVHIIHQLIAHVVLLVEIALFREHRIMSRTFTGHNHGDQNNAHGKASLLAVNKQLACCGRTNATSMQHACLAHALAYQCQLAAVGQSCWRGQARMQLKLDMPALSGCCSMQPALDGARQMADSLMISTYTCCALSGI